MNNQGMNRNVGLPTQTDGYLSWQDPESGEWMVLTQAGSPFTNGERNAAPAPAKERVGDASRNLCERCGGRNRNWSPPYRNGRAAV